MGLFDWVPDAVTDVVSDVVSLPGALVSPLIPLIPFLPPIVPIVPIWPLVRRRPWWDPKRWILGGAATTVVGAAVAAALALLPGAVGPAAGIGAAAGAIIAGATTAEHGAGHDCPPDGDATFPGLKASVTYLLRSDAPHETLEVTPDGRVTVKGDDGTVRTGQLTPLQQKQIADLYKRLMAGESGPGWDDTKIASLDAAGKKYPNSPIVSSIISILESAAPESAAPSNLELTGSVLYPLENGSPRYKVELTDDGHVTVRNEDGTVRSTGDLLPAEKLRVAELLRKLKAGDTGPTWNDTELTTVRVGDESYSNSPSVVALLNLLQDAAAPKLEGPRSVGMTHTLDKIR